jgi:hypothetical protein
MVAPKSSTPKNTKYANFGSVSKGSYLELQNKLAIEFIMVWYSDAQEFHGGSQGQFVLHVL